MNELRMVLDGLFPNADLDENSIKKGLLAFSEYDLKEQFPFNEYKDRVVINKYYNSEELKGDKTKAFFVYKALTILDKDLEFCDKKASTFDPDNSSGKCDFTKELYNVLWGFNYEYGYFGTIDVFPIIDNKSLLWGGDCLNSLQTTIYSKFGISTYKCLEQMSENEKSFLDKMKKSAMGTLFEVSHAPGNFGIVPAYFNGYRGTSSCLHDYLPQSLFFLKESKNHDYSLVDKLEAYTRNSKYKNGDAKLYFQEYSPKIFRKYINIMMLWDLVSYKNDGTIDVYDYNGSKIKGLAEAQVIDNLSVWSNGVNKFVRRRGLFIGALMYTYLFFNEEYKTVQSLFFIDENIIEGKLNGYDAIFEKINKKIKNEMIKNVFSVCKKTMNEIG